MGIPILELLDIIINNKDTLLNNNNTESNIQIWILDLIDKKVGGNHTSTWILDSGFWILDSGFWIHPDLVIQQVQLISSSFALQVSYWIRTLFIECKVKSQY
jgi:hypothetical protein